LSFLDRFSKKNTQISNIMLIRPGVAESFDADRQTNILYGFILVRNLSFILKKEQAEGA